MRRRPAAARPAQACRWYTGVMSPRVLGVDACRLGWVGVVLDVEAEPVAHLARTFGDVVAAADVDGVVDLVGVDIPIGLPDHGRRQADVLARARIGPRRSSVFMTPVRQALEAPDHASAVAVNRRLVGEGVSIQAFGLRRRILEVEAWSRRTARRVVEVHPEVSFAALAGGPLQASKKTWAGVEQRRRLLADGGVYLREHLGEAGWAAVDDVLDAAVVAWTARRLAAGQAECLPDPPERFADGHPCAIWV